MKPDKQQLIQDLLEADRVSRRDATLLAGAGILRRRRQWRAAARGLTVACVFIAAALWVSRSLPPQPEKAATQVAKAPASAPAFQILTDEQLLALFPNTPVALATLADGKKRLIFPCPADEQKYVIHL